MKRARVIERPEKVFVYDIETKPGAYWYDDVTTTLVCAWSGKFVGERGETYFLVPEWLHDHVAYDMGERYNIIPREYGLALLKRRIEEADVLVTHNGKRFDDPIIQGAFDRCDLGQLPKRKHVDTLRDRRSTKGIPRSLAALAETYDLPLSKQHVSRETWERAYEFEPEAIKAVIKRAASDVQLTEDLYFESLRRGILK